MSLGAAFCSSYICTTKLKFGTLEEFPRNNSRWTRCKNPQQHYFLSAVRSKRVPSSLSWLWCFRFFTFWTLQRSSNQFSLPWWKGIFFWDLRFGWLDLDDWDFQVENKFFFGGWVGLFKTWTLIPWNLRRKVVMVRLPYLSWSPEDHFNVMKDL